MANLFMRTLIRRAVSNANMPFNKLMVWEPWQGCTPVSEACLNCYYRFHPEIVLKPTRELERTEFPEGMTVITSFMSDFFHPGADQWRRQIWKVIARNPHTKFLLLTKRIERINVELPLPLHNVFHNLILGVTVENQKQADIRLPILSGLPLTNKYISCSPLLEQIQIRKYLDTIRYVSVAGEVAKNGRELDFTWVKDLQFQCEDAGTEMFFKDTGSLIRVNGILREVSPLFQRRLAKKLMSEA